jgi:ABC-type lipoprotein release transport system permease subunit
MTWIKLLGLAFKNVLKSQRKSRLALLSVASGFLSLNLFQAYIHDSELLFDYNYSKRSMLGDALIRKEDRNANLNEAQSQAILAFIKNHAGEIEATVRFLNFNGVINSGETQAYFTGYGYDLEEGRKTRGDDWKWNVVAGVPLDQAKKPGILIGRRLADVMGCVEETPYKVMTGKTGYAATERKFHCPSPTLQLSLSTSAGQVNALELEPTGLIDGLFSDVDQRLVVAPIATVQSLLRTDEISTFALKLKRSEMLAQLQESFKSEVQNANPEIFLRSWSGYEIGDFYIKSVEFLHIFRNFMTIVIISIASLSVLGTFFRLVYERTREIGTLLSLGFRVSQIYTMFFFESLMLSLLGVAVGAILSYVIATLLNLLEFPYKLGMLSEPVPFSMSISLRTLWMSSATVTVIALVFSMIPVHRALKMNITEALRDT